MILPISISESCPLPLSELEVHISNCLSTMSALTSLSNIVSQRVLLIFSQNSLLHCPQEGDGTTTHPGPLVNARKPKVILLSSPLGHCTNSTDILLPKYSHPSLLGPLPPFQPTPSFQLDYCNSLPTGLLVHSSIQPTVLHRMDRVDA